MTSIIAVGTATLGLGGLAALPARAMSVKADVNTPVLDTQSIDLTTALVDVQLGAPTAPEPAPKRDDSAGGCSVQLPTHNDDSDVGFAGSVGGCFISGGAGHLDFPSFPSTF
jgi:hypothetical protein